MHKTERDVERCDREIAEIDARDPNDPEARAYLSVMGKCDWEHEKRKLGLQSLGEFVNLSRIEARVKAGGAHA